MNHLEKIVKIKLDLSKVNKPKKKQNYIEPNPCGEPGYVAYGTKIKDGVEVPNCIPDPEEMKKIIKDGFPIPSPSSDEDEQTYISRCISSIIDEYGEEKGLGICYSQWENRGS